MIFSLCFFLLKNYFFSTFFFPLPFSTLSFSLSRPCFDSTSFPSREHRTMGKKASSGKDRKLKRKEVRRSGRKRNR